MEVLKQFLDKPFPQEESLAATLKIVAAISVFVTVFLYMFKPFGLHQIQTGFLWLCLGFGCISFVASMVYEWFVVKVLKFKGEGTHFTYGRWILYFNGAMLFISVANFLFVRLAVIGHIDWSLFPYMIRGTFAIGFFPIIAMGAWALLVQEKKYQGIASEVNHDAEETKATKVTSSGSVYDIPLSQIRYVEAMQNYIKIARVNEVGELTEKVERATLKGLSEQDLGNSLVRCHRSFFVNRDAITSTAGNAQGLLLSLSDCDRPVPVSRSYVSAFRRK